MTRPPSKFELRVFSVLQLPFLFLAGQGLLSWGLHPILVGLIGFGSLIAAILGLMHPHSIQGYYRVWMAAVSPIGWTITHLLLAIAYFGVVTPIGLLRRLFTGDPLHKSPDRNATTYWQRRSTPKSIEHYFRQF